MASPATRSSLPQEIVGLIMDDLASQREEDNKCMDALCVSLLVSRSFYYASRRWIFYKVNLKFDWNPNNDHANVQLARFRALLDGNEDLAKQVRALSLTLYCPQYLLSPTEFERELRRRTDENLPRILEMLSGENVHSLELERYKGRLDFDYFTDQMLASFLAIRCNSSLRTLAFKGLRNLFRCLLIGSPAHDKLQNLLIEELNPTQCYSYRSFMGPKGSDVSSARPATAKLLEAIPDTAEPPLQRLKHLTIDEPANFLDFIRSLDIRSLDKPIPYSSFSFIALRSLSITRVNGGLSFCNLRELFPTTPSLTTLTLKTNLNGVPNGINLINLQVGLLRSLKSLRWKICTLDWTTNVSVSVIRILFQQSETAVNLESLTIALEWGLGRVGQELVVLNPAAEWAELDEVLTSWRLPSLRHITISLYWQYSWLYGYTNDQRGERTQVVRDLAQHILPRVSAHREIERNIITEVA